MLGENELMLQKTRAAPRGRRGDESPPRKFLTPLEKCVARNLKQLDTIQNIWALLRKVFAPPGVISWLRACQKPSWKLRHTTQVEFSPDMFFTWSYISRPSDIYLDCFHPKLSKKSLKCFWIIPYSGRTLCRTASLTSTAHVDLLQ